MIFGLLRFCLILWLCLITASIVEGQSVSVEATDNNRTPLFGATIKLSSVADTNIVLFASASESGIAIFPNIVDGLYIVRISSIGYHPVEKTISVKANNRTFSFILKENPVELGAVTITADRPFIRQEDDKMIIDPSPMIGISTNTLEVLESTPGLYVDYDAGIFLSSSSPAVIFVNGREQKLSNQDIINLLRNLPPGSIEKIEVIRTPSTKYDAASSGGIINIVLKKGMKLGRYGNINAGMNQGKYGNRLLGLSFNNSGNKTSYYLNANYNRNDVLEELNTTRYLGIDTSLHQQSESRPISNQLYLGYGLVYEAGKKSSINYDGRISYSDRNTKALSNSYIESIAYLHLLESEDNTNNQYDNLSISQDIGLSYKIDTLGSEWINAFSCSLTKSFSDQHYSSAYTLPFDTLILGQGSNDFDRQFFVFQSDLTYQLPQKYTLESGIKGSWQHFGSQSDYFNLSGDDAQIDNMRSNHYTYQEGILAAYTQVSKTIWMGIVLKTGCRMEYTYMNGHQLTPNDTSFHLRRADLFPYVYISRPLPIIMGIELRTYLIYRRTITRPDYQNLNPSFNYIDPFLYEVGNPNLKPQFTDNIEFNVSYEDMPVFAIGINYTTDIFSSVVYQDVNQRDVAVMTYDNLGKSKETYLRGMIGIPPGGRYFFALGGQYNLNEYNGYYDGEALSYKRDSWRLFTFHSLKLFKQTKLNMSGFMMINGQRGFYELSNFGSLNFGISQTFMHQKLIITINARDVFHSMRTGFELNIGSTQTMGDRYTDNQRIGINVRFNFGLGKRENRNGFSEPDDDSL